MSMRDDQLGVLNVGEQSYDYYRIADLEGIDHLPYSLKVLVENLVRNEDGANITDEHLERIRKVVNALKVGDAIVVVRLLPDVEDVQLVVAHGHGFPPNVLWNW